MTPGSQGGTAGRKELLFTEMGKNRFGANLRSQFSIQMDCLVYLFGVLGRGWGLKCKSESHQMQMVFKAKCFELLGKKSLKVIFIPTLLLWQSRCLCLGIPTQSLGLSLIYFYASRPEVDDPIYM